MNAGVTPGAGTSASPLVAGSIWLDVDDGGEPSHVVALSGASTIGRDLQCEVVVYDDEASRQHARLRPTPAGWAVEDLGTTNGTSVNAARIVGPALVRVGDVIGVGRARCTVVAPPDK
ncbi:MAG TPA: FHA domain-containing protein [Ilumatobacteraceae bacterium]|nr:FHA domain-containing protein [Ilumatobacteraceae bacterium]